LKIGNRIMIAILIGIWISVRLKRSIVQPLQKAVTMANTANRAKSEFLAVMSHELPLPSMALLACTI